MRHKVEIEELFSSSVKVLFSRLSTPDGLAEWFADEVMLKNDIYKFIWKDSEQSAELLRLEPNKLVRFRWLDSEDEDEDEYFEFRIEVDALTNDLALVIVDFVDSDDDDDIHLWDKQLDKLHRVLGA